YRNLSAEFEDFSDNSINDDNATGSLVPAVGQISTNSTNTFSVAGPSNATVSPTHEKSSYIDTSQLPDYPNMPELEDITYSDDEDVGAEADFTNLETTITVSPIPTTSAHKDHPLTQIIGDLSLATQTRSMTRVAKDQDGLSQINNDDFHTCMFACFLSQDEPKREEGIDYEEVFAPVARIEAIRLFLAHASFMGFMVYQIDVKSAFLYGTIEEEVYVCQPLGFKDRDHPDKVYKVVKALYGLHQALRAWYETLANYLLENDFQKGKIDQTLFIQRKQVKKVNDVSRLQALVDRKKVIITEAIIIDALHLDVAEGIDCLPNEEIFTELARMGYEKPSTKLTFYKAFFSSQWKFLIYTILQCMSAKRTSWNEFSSSIASAVICLSTCRKFNFSKYIFDSLVTNVDSPTKFYMYPCFMQLMIRAQVGDLSSYTIKYSSPALTQKVFVNMRRVGKGCSGVETPLFEGMITTQHVGEGPAEVNVDDVPAVGVADEGAASVNDDDVPAAVDEPSIPSPTPFTQPPPTIQDLPSTSQDADISMDLLQYLLDTCTILTRRVENLEQDKIAQALEITKLKQRVKKLERRNKLKASKLRRLKKVGASQRIKTSDDTVMDDEKGSSNKRSSPSTIIHSEAKSKDKGKWILVEEPKALKKQAQIEQDEAYVRELEVELNKNIDWDEVIDHVQRKEKEDNVVKRYQALKKKPQTKTQARKNMMIYLRNTKEQMEEDSRALKRINESQDDKAAKKQKMDEEVEELRKHLHSAKGR
nr:putative ribonuclease H-like domain-containing protein [Tanacetum cinerariifolium]